MPRLAVATMRFTDTTGTHETGSTVTLPYETEDDRASFHRLLDYGVIAEATDSPRRPSRNRKRA